MQFIQPDTIIPEPYNPQSWNRYAYSLNNPLRYTDPSGHAAADVADGTGCGPDCLLKHLAYQDKARGRALGEYFRTHPKYDPSTDSALDNTNEYIVSTAKSAYELDSAITNGTASLASVAAFMASSMFGSIIAGPVIIESASSAPKNYGNDLADSDCSGCGFRIRASSPEDILMPDGVPVGTPGKSKGVQTVQTVGEMREIFDALTVNGTPYTPKTPYDGQLYQLPDGGTVGWRNSSNSGGPVIEINIPDIPFKKIHLQ